MELSRCIIYIRVNKFFRLCRRGRQAAGWIGKGNSMTLEEMKRRKQERGYTNERLSELSGVPLGTVQKIMSGKTKAPREETLRRLWKALVSANAQEEIDALFVAVTADNQAAAGKAADLPGDRGLVAETVRKYAAKRPGEYTLEDYLALPDEQRVELIDGVFYDMAAPTTIHQSIAGFLHKKFLDHVMEHKGPCFPFNSPVDVQLDCDDKTVIQPDVLIVCDRGKYRNGRVFGAPDLVVEVLSPSSRKRDLRIKLAKYYDAGVREYWIVDPEKKMLVQYDMEHLELPSVYNCESTIPVLIWNSECRIDLREMFDTIGFLWETE